MRSCYSFIFVLVLLFVSSCKPFNPKIQTQELVKPSLEDLHQINIVFSTGFYYNDVFFKVGEHVLIEGLLSSEESTEMASPIITSLDEDGESYFLKIDGQEFVGRLDRTYKGLMILIQQEQIIFRYSNSNLQFE